MSEHLRVGRRNDPNAFASEVIRFLLEDEPANCLMAAILFIREGLGGQYLATVYDNHGLRGVAFRTPLKLLLSRMDEDAARTLAADAYRAIPELDEVLGPRPEVDAFAAAWSSLTGRAARSGRLERIYRLDEVEPVHGVSGIMRPIREGDRAIVVPWIEAMNAELGDYIDLPTAKAVFERHLVSHTAFLWDHNGPASMAAARASSPNTCRISLVYTPPECRRRGYAAALVAAVSQHVLNSGTRWCVLYTDLTNPTSNHIYQQIGYQPICDAQEYSLSGERSGLRL